MNTPRLSGGAYTEYSQRLKSLHALIRDGQGDSDEADAIRDEMDVSYRQLSTQEIDQLENLSSDFNWLSEIDRIRDRVLTKLELRHEIMLAVTEEDWAGLRSILTVEAANLGESEGLLFRSVYWLGRGDIESSLTFLGTLGDRLESQSLDIEAKRAALRGWIDRHGTEDREILESSRDFERLARWCFQLVVPALEETRRLISMVKRLHSAPGETAGLSHDWSQLKRQISRVEAYTWATSGRAA